jgi:hypothetical protein
VNVKAGGALLPDGILLLDPAATIVVQLHNDAGECPGALYSRPAASDATKYKAKSD